jgi:FkbM family methyltransferase
MHPRLAFLILPLVRLELPGWGRLLQLFKVSGISNYDLWAEAPTKTMRGKWHSYQMKVDLANWSDRLTYFLGRYYDLEIQLVMQQVLQPGDRFIDIGANIGMITLHGAALVTESGRVDSFEPNPECCQRIQDTLAMNQIQHVHLHPVGLSDQPGTLTLSVITDTSGMGTLAAPREDDQNLISQRFEVTVQVGDNLILPEPTPVKLIKIDVEGFELNVLRGLEKTLTAWHPIVVTEVVQDWLERAGTNRTQLYQFMQSLGYSPYGLTTRRQFLQHQLLLAPIAEESVENAEFTDFLWLHPKSAGREGLRK